MVAHSCQCNNNPIYRIPFKWIAMRIEKKGIIEFVLRIGINAESIVSTNCTIRSYLLYAPIVRCRTKDSRQRKRHRTQLLCLSNACEMENREENCSETALMYFSTLVLVPLLFRSATKALFSPLQGQKAPTVLAEHAHTHARRQTKMKRKLFDVFQSHFELSSPHLGSHEMTMQTFVRQLLCQFLVSFPFSLLANWHFIISIIINTDSEAMIVLPDSITISFFVCARCCDADDGNQ